MEAQQSDHSPEPDQCKFNHPKQVGTNPREVRSICLIELGYLGYNMVYVSLSRATLDITWYMSLWTGLQHGPVHELCLQLTLCLLIGSAMTTPRRTQTLAREHKRSAQCLSRTPFRVETQSCHCSLVTWYPKSLVMLVIISQMSSCVTVLPVSWPHLSIWTPLGSRDNQ